MTVKTKKIRSVLCGLVSFILCVSLTLLLMLLTVRATILNAGYAKMIVQTSGYSSLMQTELKEQFVSYGSACNVDESFFDGVFEDVITPELIEKDTQTSLEYFYKHNSEGTIDTSELEGKILTKLTDYAREKGFTVDDSLTENLKVMCKEMGELYVTYVGMFNTSYFASASNVLKRYMPVFNRAIIGLAVFSILATVVIRLSYAKTKNFTRYYIYACSGSALMLAVAPAVALIMRIGSKINVANASLFSFASGFINYTFAAMLVAALIMAVLTGCIVYVRNKAVKQNK